MRAFTGITITGGLNVIDLTYKPLLAGNPVENQSSFNTIDIYDYNAIVTDFGPRMPPEGSLADFDFDSDVDIFDYNFLVGNFGKFGETL